MQLMDDAFCCAGFYNGLAGNESRIVNKQLKIRTINTITLVR